MAEFFHGFGNNWAGANVSNLDVLPAFERAPSFYERKGFSITGGRKLKIAL